MGAFDTDYDDRALEIKKRADAGDSEAQFEFGYFLLREKDRSFRSDLTEEMIKRAISYYKKAATSGYRSGFPALELGDLHFRGEIVEQDYEKAAEYFILASKKGFVNAEYKLGDMFRFGQYFKQDIDMAWIMYLDVLDKEEVFYNKYGIYSDAYSKTIERIKQLDKMESREALDTQIEIDTQKDIMENIIKDLNIRFTKTILRQLEDAHKESVSNKPFLKNASKCGCFHCLRIFKAGDIIDWTGDVPETAICPNCSVDSIISDNMGFPLDDDFLAKMKLRWFSY